MTRRRRTETMVPTPDGRTLRLEETGDPEGKPVLYLHGTPSAGYAYARHIDDALARGIRLLAYDRPGYGWSTAKPGRSVADCAEDVRAIAQALNLERIAVWGVSGGGPHALACAALLPDLAVAVASLAAIAPYGVSGFDYFDGMGQENVDEIKLWLSDESAARRKEAADRARVLALTPDEMVKAFPTLLSAADVAVHSRELTEWLTWGDHAGLAFGGQGWWDDMLAVVRPWGFAFDSIKVPVQLWHGRHDRFVPFQHGEWLAGQIPGVDAHLTDVDGHLTLLQNRIPEVHSWLLEHF